MDVETSTRHNVELLERVLLDRKAEPTYVPLALFEDITNCFSDEIGSGGFAVVYKGRVGNRLVAVKKLSQTFDIHESKFHKEVECLMKAKHKNIVRFLGYCSDTQGRVADYEGKFVIADIRNWLLCFEYVPNGSLDKYITDAYHGLEWRERYQLIKGICEGLLHLHKKRIIHSDLKPNNILIDDHMVPKIADFGLSRCLDKDQSRAFTSHLCGTQGYMAPEFYRGQVAFASDIYSLGVIILEMLTGEKGYPEEENVVRNWMNRLDASEERETQLEQVKVCTKTGIECMDLDPKKRPVASDIIDRFNKLGIASETGISSSSVEQQDIKEDAEMKELAKCFGILRKDHWKRRKEAAPGYQCSLLQEAQDTKQNDRRQGASISSSNSGVLYKLNNLDIFNRNAHRNYLRNGGPTLEKAKCVKLFKRGELKPVLKDDNFIGKDRFGEVYKGLIGNLPVTVRKLIGGTVIENEQFANEVIMQCQIKHPNISTLMGCCVEVDNPVLVYGLQSKCSLDDILHGNNKVPLNLDVRLSIAVASARGLAYGHSNIMMKILHGDLKPASIHFEGSFVPKILDFGISRFMASDCKHTELVDIAYMDPVYKQTGLLTEQSDVYSFGVVILELLTRKKATHTRKNRLVKNFLANHKKGRNATELFDKEIALTGDVELLDNLAEIAVRCLNDDKYLRPRIADVADQLSILKRSSGL